jgi:uncharacterized protein (TIGR02117 family)
MRLTMFGMAIAVGLSLAGGDAVARTYIVFVSSNGWHTDITIARADIPAGKIPESADFAHAQYLQFGWGDENYYTEPDPGLGTTLGAAFPGPAVVHLAGLSRRPAETFTGVEEVTLTLDEATFVRLVDFLHGSFERGGEARATSSGPGVYSFSRFYPATGEFHLFNTCNTWTARALAHAGLDVKAGGVQEADEVMRQLRKPPPSQD